MAIPYGEYVDSFGTDNSCMYAWDGMCDEPDYCPVGTDSYDCANPGPQCKDDSEWKDNMGDDCSVWSANPGWCVDQLYPPSDYANASGVDATEACCVCAGNSVGQGSSGGGGGGFGDSCDFANDGMCDEPDFCLWGTDTTDCSTYDPYMYDPYGYGGFLTGGFGGGAGGGDSTECQVRSLNLLYTTTAIHTIC